MTGSSGARRLLHMGGTYPWDFNALLSIPHVPHAVYLFWSVEKRRFIYVGKTDRSVQVRLQEHRRHSSNAVLRSWIRDSGEDLEVCYVSCPAACVAKLERRLIRRYEPVANQIYNT